MLKIGAVQAGICVASNVPFFTVLKKKLTLSTNKCQRKIGTYGCSSFPAAVETCLKHAERRLTTMCVEAERSILYNDSQL